MMLPVAILAGGLATRLRPITDKIPKALVEVAGQPFIMHQLNLLKRNAVGRVVLCVGYRGEMIQDVVGNGNQFDIKIEYSFDGKNLLGTGGAIKKALPLLGKEFFVLYGDAYLPCNYKAVQRVFKNSRKMALMTIFHNKGEWDASNVEFKDGRILDYDKKNPSDRMQHIDYGLGVFKASSFEKFPENEYIDLAQIYRVILENGELAAFEIKQRFYEIGSFDGVEEMKRYLAHNT